MAYPFTFHMQVKEDPPAQDLAHHLGDVFSKPEVIQALDGSGIIHFARIVLIPNRRVVPGTTGTFAVQIIMVHDDEPEDLLNFFWRAMPMRSLFIALSEIGKISCRDTGNPEHFRTYITENNINRKARELHKGYDLTVKQIREKFGHAADLTVAGLPANEIKELNIS